MAAVDDLKNDLSIWLNRNDPETLNAFDKCIANCEERIWRELRSDANMQSYEILIMPDGTDAADYAATTFGTISNPAQQGEFQLPFRYYEAINIYSITAEETSTGSTEWTLASNENNHTMSMIDAQAFLNLTSTQTNDQSTGAPQYIARLMRESDVELGGQTREINTFRVWPRSDFYWVIMHVWGGQTPLGSEDTFGTLSNIYIQHPQIYLYGSMAEACLFLKDWEQHQIWEQRFVNEIERTNQRYQESQLSGSTRLQGMPYAVGSER